MIASVALVASWATRGGVHVVAAVGAVRDPGTDRGGRVGGVPSGDVGDAGAGPAGRGADEPFAGSFGRRGAPGLSPAVLSLVTALQFTENLTDRQAAAMTVRAIDWKYAIGAELTDTGFDATVLSRFRARLAQHGMERVVFDRLLEVCRDQGLIWSGGKQRTDSTHVISAVRDLNRTELAGQSVRGALEALAVAAAGWPTRWTFPSSRTATPNASTGGRFRRRNRSGTGWPLCSGRTRWRSAGPSGH
ncbi:transposase [Streptomyces sp. NPDC052682]|uniref:transposase n=1 Tax=Streptomyces sp. NPDC052682 TaxID=3154954 RepID=UPI00341A9776